MNGRRVAVVALGELARCPRMLNHARSLAARGCEVVLIGYQGRKFDLPPAVEVVPLDGGSRAADTAGAAAFLLHSAWRMARVFLRLYRALRRARPHRILVQNPPSFPTLLASWLAARRCGARLVVDWHNYGYTLLAPRLGARHPFTRIAGWYELRIARHADAHFCVSAAMRADLARRTGINAAVLYDRPLSLPVPSTPGPGPHLLCVCPCGWTADEDVPLLLDALAAVPDGVAVHLTGDGPARAALEPRLAPLRARGVLATPGFLPEPDYRALLHRAALGISVHRSTSGLDLAMKVVDLMSSGVPCCVLAGAESLSEQVRDGVTGFHFRTARELADLLSRLHRDGSTLAAMRRHIVESARTTWDDEWDRVARPVLLGEA